jgi:hypothetical protein
MLSKSRNDVGRECSTHGEMRNAHKILAAKPLWKRRFV